MRLHDRHRRVLAQITWRRWSLGPLFIERVPGMGPNLMISWRADWLWGQSTRERCAKCTRWVPVACEVSSDPERCMQADGPWDSACQDFYYPWRVHDTW